MSMSVFARVYDSVLEGFFDSVCLIGVAPFYLDCCLLAHEDNLHECGQGCYIQNTCALNQTEV